MVVLEIISTELISYVDLVRRDDPMVGSTVYNYKYIQLSSFYIDSLCFPCLFVGLIVHPHLSSMFKSFFTHLYLLPALYVTFYKVLKKEQHHIDRD